MARFWPRKWLSFWPRSTILVILVGQTGCASLSLENYTLREVRTAEQFRIDATLDSLATAAASPDTLPPFGLAISGTSKIQDMESLSATTVWTRAINGFASEALMASLSRQPQGTWSVEPVGDNAKLEAVRCACRWIVYGPQAACRDCGNLLEDPTTDYSPQEPRFGVADRLRRIRTGWLHQGKLVDVPLCAKCRGHYKDTWVWVMPEDGACLSEFMLVLHDIATLDESALYSAPLLVTITRNVDTFLKTTGAAGMDPNKLNPLVPAAKEARTPLQLTEYRVIRPEMKPWIEGKIQTAMLEGKSVDISLQQWLEWTYAYNGTRTNAKTATGPQSAGATATTLQQQNLVPSTRNPSSPGYLGGNGPTPQEIQRLKELLQK